MKTAYAETFNASIDQAVGRGVLSVSYAGSHGIHLYDIANINLGGYGGEFLGDARFANRLNYQYGSMNYRSDNGLSRYNALNVKYGVTNLGHKGLGITANYTFSHSLDNISSTFTDGYESLYGLGYLDAFNPRLNYGNSDFDIRHRFTLGATWDVPWLKNASNAFVRTVFGGWGMGTIVNIRGGLPFTVFDCSNFSGQNCPLYAAGVPVQRAGSATTTTGADAQANIFNYIQLPVSAGAPAGLGNSQGIPNCTGLLHVGCTYTVNNAAYPDRNQFISPNFWNTDMNFYKTFKLTERFWLCNSAASSTTFSTTTTSMCTLTTSMSSSMTANSVGNFYVQSEKGGVLGVGGAPTDERRNIQFGLKLMF